jgi:23S rRNA pseudouridine1911/1915/1917 synthase
MRSVRGRLGELDATPTLAGCRPVHSRTPKIATLRKVGRRMRLDKLVTARFGLSRREAQSAIRLGRVDISGQPCLEPGREVAAESPVFFDPHRKNPASAARQLPILYEDRHVIVVDKPAGMLTQPTPARERGTLIERVGRYLARTRGLQRPYVGVVQRLDRDTSGAILLVCSPRALRPFQAIFRTHGVERVYHAFVEGLPRRPEGTIDLPLVPDRGDGRKGVARGVGRGIRAVTHYEVIEEFGSRAAWLACRLETGRTHQIRIHLAEIGHAVIGELVYRPRTMAPFPIPVGRQALHAHALGFDHPLARQSIRVEAPLPDDLARLIDSLRQHA